MVEFSEIPEVLEDLKQGKMIVLVDDEDRENEGDLVCAAEYATPETINFMATHGRGLICVPLTEERCDSLGLHAQSPDNTAQLGTAFTVSVDARQGITTGISAADRSHTIRLMAKDDTVAADLARPGHIFPLRARNGGVLVRAGQTEGAVDLMRLAGLKPAGVICEIINDDGTMSRVPELLKYFLCSKELDPIHLPYIQLILSCCCQCFQGPDPPGFGPVSGPGHFFFALDRTGSNPFLKMQNQNLFQWLFQGKRLLVKSHLSGHVFWIQGKNMWQAIGIHL